MRLVVVPCPGRPLAPGKISLLANANPVLARRAPYLHLGSLQPSPKHVVSQNSIGNMIEAVTKRVFLTDYGNGYVDHILPQRDAFTLSMQSVTELFDKRRFQATPWTQSQVVASYDGRKRTIYQNAKDKLRYKSLDKVSANVKPFVKSEKLKEKVGLVPRVISPRSPEYNLLMGRYSKPLEGIIYRIINQSFFDSPIRANKTVFKGLNATQRGSLLDQKWKRFSSPVAVGLDAKRFDQHTSKQALLFEHSIYTQFFRGDKHLKKLLQGQLVNKCTAYFPGETIKYTTTSRMSGDMTTSLGNILLMCSMMKSYIDSLGIQVEVADDGDDIVVIMEERDLETFSQGVKSYFINFGYYMEVEEPVRIFEKIVLCQAQPVFDGDQYIMVRDPRTAIDKDCILQKFLDAKAIKQWYASMGTGGLRLTGGIPIWQNFYRLIKTKAQGAKALKDATLENTGLMRLGMGMKRDFQPVKEETRNSFYLAFDISPVAQLASEGYYDTVEITNSVEDTVQGALLPF